MNIKLWLAFVFIVPGLLIALISRGTRADLGQPQRLGNLLSHHEVDAANDRLSAGDRDPAHNHGSDSVEAIDHVRGDLSDLADLAAPVTHRTLVIRVDFQDQRGALFSPAIFRNYWIEDLIRFFGDVSNGNLIWEPTVFDQVVTLGPRRLYHPGALPLLPGETTRSMWAGNNIPPVTPADLQPIQTVLDAGVIEQAGNGLVPAGGTDPFDSILFVITSPTTATIYDRDNCGTSFADWSTGPGSAVADISGRSYHFGITKEDGNGNCGFIVDRTDIGGAAHELGHMIAENYRHPAAYNNRFDLMDNCYPCEPGIFTRTSTALKGSGFSEWFAGWIPDDKVHVFSPPTGGTEVLAPLEVNPATAASPMGLKVETGVPGEFYMVECRRELPTDDILPIPDSGVQIIRARAKDDPETKVMPVPGIPLNPISVLWDPGLTFTDVENDLRIKIGPDIGNGCTVSVEYGTSVRGGVPDVALIPWYSPPMNTYETVDIWVDSSCNDYEDEGGELKYGRRADPARTVIGNGDNPCANHENRIYATIRNIGDKPANDVQVKIQLTDPLGVGIRGPEGWVTQGEVLDHEIFPELASIGPGETVNVYVPWTPEVEDAELFEDGEFDFHSCIRVIVETVDGEVITGNQDGEDEQENIFTFEAVTEDEGLTFAELEGEIGIGNDFGLNIPLDYYLWVHSELPEGWSLDLADGQRMFQIDPTEVVKIPVRIQVPSGTPVGQSYFVEAEATAMVPLYNDHGEIVHYENRFAGGVLLQAQTVNAATLTHEVDLSNACPVSLNGSGFLSPAVAGTKVGIDYVDPNGAVQSFVVDTAADGSFEHNLPVALPGEWKVSAFWQGSTELSSVATAQKSVMVSTTGAFLVNDPFDSGDSNPGDGVCNTGQGACSIRAAVQESNALPGCQTIFLPDRKNELSIPGSGEDGATTGDLDITDALAITGVGTANSIVDGGGLDTVFDIVTENEVQFYGFTIQNGRAGGYPGGLDNDGNLLLRYIAITGNQSDANAGGAWNSGSMRLENSSVSGNISRANGGGLYNRSGVLTLVDSSITGNRAERFDGGGIANNLGTVVLQNSLVAENYAEDDGGGIANDSILQIGNSTISGNQAENRGGGLFVSNGRSSMNNATIAENEAENGAGGGIVVSGGQVILANSIIDGNDSMAGGEDDCAGSLHSAGYNLIRNVSGCTLAGDLTGNKTGEAALLGPLAANGGPTRSHSLKAGSPALDTGNPALPGISDAACLTSDQRGVGRHQGVGCDMGAIEVIESQGSPLKPFGRIHLPLILR